MDEDDALASKAGMFTPLMEAANSMHELVTEFQKAGFSRQEAIYMVLEIFKNASGGD